MSSNYYKLYIDSVLDLASTLVIKSEYSAEMINDLIKAKYGQDAVDPYTPNTWKYYLNVCGLYHPTDEIITITSLDDQTNITFDQTTLLNHPLTKYSYRYGSRFYRELITAHPDKELVIIGALYPSDINKAIQAKDGSVLSYPTYLVEPNEVSLISNIENWIYEYKVRWENKQFNLTDSLYSASNLAIMYLNLVPLILNLRLKACKTNEAHSYHVREYLASHGMLDVYLEFLTLKQALFLYRNICYIERNAGKRETLGWLIEKIMTDRNLPISEITMKHKLTDMEDSLYPEITFRKKNLNNIYGGSSSINTPDSLDELLLKEEPLAIGNKDYTYSNKLAIKSKFENSLSSVVATKALESSTIDYTDNQRYSIIDIQLNSWLHLSSIGLYNALITYVEPRTGTEYVLKAFDAYVFWFYCYCKSLDIDLLSIDYLACERVVNPQQVSKTDLQELIPTLRHNVNLPNKNAVKIKRLDKLVDDILASQTYVSNINSVMSFNNQTKALYNNTILQSNTISKIEDIESRGISHAIVDRLYVDRKIDLIDTFNNLNLPIAITRSVFLTTRGLPLIEYSREEYETIYSQLFTAATGGSLYTTEEKSKLQKAMIKLLQKLSSYSIQFLSEINQQKIKNLNWSTIRVNEAGVSTSDSKKIANLAIRPFDLIVQENEELQIKVNPATVGSRTETITSNVDTLNITVKPFIGKLKGTIYKHLMRFGTISVNHQFGFDPAFVGGIKQFDSYDNYNLLTDIEQQTIKDVYYQVFEQDVHAGKINISKVILTDVLQSYKHLLFKKHKLESFKYFYVPSSANSIRRTIYETIEGFYPNFGTREIQAFKLFNKIQIANLFKYFAKTQILNGFKDFSGTVVAFPEILKEWYEIGTQLEIFKYSIKNQSIPGLLYSANKDSINFTYTYDKYESVFVQPLFKTSVAMHPTKPGQVLNAFKLINSTYVLGGFDHSNYTITGFSYNGNILDFS